MSNPIVAPAPPVPSGRVLQVNSTLAFVLAALVNDTLHELAHAVAGLSQHLVPTLTPFAVNLDPEGSPRQ